MIRSVATSGGSSSALRTWRFAGGLGVPRLSFGSDVRPRPRAADPAEGGGSGAGRADRAAAPAATRTGDKNEILRRLGRPVEQESAGRRWLNRNFDGDSEQNGVPRWMALLLGPASFAIVVGSVLAYTLYGDWQEIQRDRHVAAAMEALNGSSELRALLCPDGGRIELQFLGTLVVREGFRTRYMLKVRGGSGEVAELLMTVSETAEMASSANPQHRFSDSAAQALDTTLILRSRNIAFDLDPGAVNSFAAVARPLADSERKAPSLAQQLRRSDLVANPDGSVNVGKLGAMAAVTAAPFVVMGALFVRYRRGRVVSLARRAAHFSADVSRALGGGPVRVATGFAGSANTRQGTFTLQVRGAAASGRLDVRAQKVGREWVVSSSLRPVTMDGGTGHAVPVSLNLVAAERAADPPVLSEQEALPPEPVGGGDSSPSEKKKENETP